MLVGDRNVLMLVELVKVLASDEVLGGARRC